MCIQKIASRSSKQPHAGVMSMAVFRDDLAWDVGSTITISFLPLDYGMPAWEIPLQEIQPNVSPAQYVIEQQARQLSSPIDVVQLVVNTLVQPVVPTLTLKFISNGQGDIRIRFSQGGPSESEVGTGCKVSTADFTMTFGWLDVGTIIHEFTHALGMLHEHQNPAGGIKWNTQAVYEWAEQTQGWTKEETDENILDAAPTNEVSNSPFDPDSIMLYAIDPKLTLDGKGTKQNYQYSATDIEWLRNKYNVDKSLPTIIHLDNNSLPIDTKISPVISKLSKGNGSIAIPNNGGDTDSNDNSDSDTNGSANKHMRKVIIIVVIVLSVLIVLGLILFFALK